MESFPRVPVSTGFVKLNTKVPVRRRERLSRAERRERLLTVADEIVRSVGVEGLTISSLADAAEVARPVVYSHFPKRQDIAIALLNHYYEVVRGAGIKKTQESGSIEEYISLVVDAGLDFAEKYGDVVERISSGFVGDVYIREAFIKYENTTTAFWSAILSDQGASRDVADIAAHMFQGMIRKGQVTLRGNPRKRKLVREILTKLILGSMRTLCPQPMDFRPIVRSRPHIAGDCG